MKTKLIAAALAGLLTTASGAAIAQDAPPPPQPRHHGIGPGGGGGMLMRADANKDGIVTREEFLASVDAHFAKMDANKDGKLTPDERPGRMSRRGMRGGPDAPPPPPAGAAPAGAPMARHMPADTNNDGVITLAEHRAQALKIFTYLDRNGDGKIDKAERESFREVAMALGGPGGPGGHGMHGRHGGGHGRHGGHRDGPPPTDAPEAPKGQ